MLNNKESKINKWIMYLCYVTIVENFLTKKIYKKEF